MRLLYDYTSADPTSGIPPVIPISLPSKEVSVRSTRQCSGRGGGPQSGGISNRVKTGGSIGLTYHARSNPSYVQSIPSVRTHLDDSVALLGYVGIITLRSFPLAYTLTLFVLARDDTACKVIQVEAQRSAAFDTSSTRGSRRVQHLHQALEICTGYSANRGTHLNQRTAIPIFAIGQLAPTW
jgi:hypothetical protein